MGDENGSPIPRLSPGADPTLCAATPLSMTSGLPSGQRRERNVGLQFGNMALELGGSQRLVVGLIGAQAVNAAFDVVALYPIAESTKWGDWAKQWAKNDLDRLGYPQRFRFVFPIIKTTSVAGLLVGLRWRALGRLTAAAIVGYFVAALGFHVRAKDPAVNYLPAIGMLMWSYGALRALKTDPI
ncbi:MAG: DoxX family protein [Acidimicrobiales bacterium]